MSVAPTNQVFLSYTREQGPEVEAVYASLSVRDYEVFLDVTRLKPGKGFEKVIEYRIIDCELFIFFISPDSVKQGSYAMTELGFAMKKWRNPSGKVLPVMTVPTVITQVPAYLKSVTILYPQGNLAAEVAATVDELMQANDAVLLNSVPGADLQRERVAAYRVLWAVTGFLPRWPRDERVTYEGLISLTASLRDWYFNEGNGMFLSRPAHQSYQALQNSVTALINKRLSGRLLHEHYDALREQCSALRTNLARDVGARG